MNELKQRIVKYANGKVKQQGFLVAVKLETNEVKIGYSLCSRVDKYNKEVAETIAYNRAYSGKHFKFPDSIKGEVEGFKMRCVRYFKDGVMEEIQ